MDDLDINDIRVIKDFKGQTFSNYKLSDVKKIFIKQLKNENINASLFWCFELICSGHISELWDCIILYIGGYIGIANPKLIIYISLKNKEFVNVYKHGYINNELLLRNNEACRSIFTEIIYILALSSKKPCIEKIKIIKDTEFILDNISNKLKATNSEYIKDIFLSDDPLELFIPLNELAYSIDKNNNFKNLWDALYWIEWILQYEKIAKDKKIILTCQYRNIININEIYKKDFIWIIWDIILKCAIKEHLQYKALYSLLELFSYNYKPNSKQKRKYLIYTAIEFIIDFNNVRFKESIIKNKELLLNKQSTINKIIVLIKKNEESPKTEYLFNNTIVEKSQTEKTIDKLNKLQDLL